MSAATIFRIENGVFALALVGDDDPAEWQAPGGETVDTVAVADYTGGPDGISFECQTTSSALTASASTTTDTTPATMCAPSVDTPVVGVTTYTLDATILQDPNVSDGISAYLFEHDTKEAYFLLGFDTDNPPKAIGRVRLVSGALGGDARVTLTASVSLPVTIKPDLWVGNATTNRVILGSGGLMMTGATSAGVITPTGATQPTSLAGMVGSGVVASPLTAWTGGQHIVLPVSGSHVYWNGTTWLAGDAP